jgi:hypothetical protein
MNPIAGRSANFSQEPSFLKYTVVWLPAQCGSADEEANR